MFKAICDKVTGVVLDVISYASEVQENYNGQVITIHCNKSVFDNHLDGKLIRYNKSEFIVI